MRSLFHFRIPAILLLLVAVFCVGVAGPHNAYAAPSKSLVLTPFTFSQTCVNSLIIFTITDEMGIDSVKWDFGDTPSGALNTTTDMEGGHVYATIGTYTVTLIAYRAGVADTTTQTITIVQPIVFAFPGNTDTTLCEGTSLVLQGPVEPGATYEWSPRADSTGSSIVADTIGTYKVKVNGCWATDSVNVFYTPIPEIDLGTDHLLCINEAIRLDATSQNGRYQWYRDFTPIPGEKASTYVVTTDGTYMVEVDAGGCGIYKDTVSLTFGGQEYPFSMGPDTLLCPGESIVLDPKVSGATRFQWYNGSRTPTITVSRPAEAWVFVQVNGQCEVLDTVVVDYNRLRGVDLGNDTTICKGEFLVLTADFGTGTYKWQDSSDQATFYVREPGWYYVRAQIGRCISSDTIRVLYDDTLRVNLGPDTLLCRGEQLKLHPAGAGGSYKWQDSTTVPIYTVTEQGYYAVVATNTCGQAVDSINVLFKDCDCQVYLPTAFSPNNDGRNDYFRPIYRCALADFKLSVYDRWGARIYYTTDPQVGWTGRQNNTPLNVGTYVWIMEYTNASTNEVVKKNGTVTVVY
ncbi:T9SS type B sorting domain-containing protein [Chitinophaga agrisoli]|uniref:T9SS type B sorting domain-containing protein n=1 Tax=Chitinophaga agrisoli TaxID=2607653 RepID=A0A5B2VUI9_9BACT|nr:gliding motility-associated C-terminal domain-containing protein [Chitinophaga agrisoli]KAA2241856.1 T9SS type B sorting domain-containing protein [Chitinophaga agrisoli]